MIRTFLLVSVVFVTLQASAQSRILDFAKKTNEYFMAKYADPTTPTNVKKIRPSHLWTRAVYYEGLMALYGVDPNGRYLDYTDRWGEFHKWTPRDGISTTDADNQCCAQTYIDRYIMTGDRKRIEQVERNLEHQMASGRVDYWTWIDAIQMAMPVYSKLYKVKNDRRYLDYAMRAYTWSRDTCGGGLFNEKEGLWWRDKDYVPPYKEKDGQNCYWSRGNGWVYAALVRVMSDIGKNDPYYGTLASDFKTMSRALVECQRTDGFWNVSLISPTTYGGPEMTGTALFLYGMSWGIMNGLLDDAAYRPVCDMAWKALASCVHDNGFLGYNQGTGKDPSAGQPVTFTSVPDFEDYGTGCFLLGVVEYYKLVERYGVQSLSWPATTTETKPGTRWWWPGSAVDADGLAWNLQKLAGAGIGTVEITPIYGVNGNEDNEIEFLTLKWMQALDTTMNIAGRFDIDVDMDCGSGWPFGGPCVPLEEAACKAIFVDTLAVTDSATAADIELPVPEKERRYAKLICKRVFPTDRQNAWRVIAVYESRTRQKVKRAAPGGEGYVIDHFDSTAVANYLARFNNTFKLSGTPFPHAFFNDSYEVYRANWTPKLFEEFAQRRGYRLEDRLPELLGYTDDGGRTLADYRETLSDLLYENFTCQWSKWAHLQGSATRNQAHGSPANLLDLYAAVDIPEIEGFGLSDFGINGLRTDKGFTRPNFSDVSMLKYASSAAHVSGKRIVSSETFTWLTEHFRTSLSQMKPDLDLMFTCGVNRVLFHGTCYSPENEPWPGWRFYASVDMSPANSIWRDAPYLMKYIERCQSFLQAGGPDNDFLVYLPVRDMWKQRLKPGDEGLLMMFDIHSIKEKAPEFINSILAIDSLGYSCDYVSDRQLADITVHNGQLVTRGGAAYKALIIPSGTTVTAELEKYLEKLSQYIIYGEDDDNLQRYAQPEQMRKTHGIRSIRRINGTGHHYFMSNLTPNDIDAYVPLAVNFKEAVWFNPMDGSTSTAQTNENNVRIRLKSGESRILKTFVSPTGHAQAGYTPDTKSRCTIEEMEEIDLTNSKWTLIFIDECPDVKQTYKLEKLQTWETLDSQTGTTMGTGVYTTTVKFNKEQAGKRWAIDLGDVRESARVYINEQYIGCAWAVPFILDCQGKLKKGNNKIRIEVTNLPANRIADMDRRGIEWRKMKDINVVDINYKHTSYTDWQLVPSGLNSTVKLVEVHE